MLFLEGRLSEIGEIAPRREAACGLALPMRSGGPDVEDLLALAHCPEGAVLFEVVLVALESSPALRHVPERSNYVTHPLTGEHLPLPD